MQCQQGLHELAYEGKKKKDKNIVWIEQDIQAKIYKEGTCLVEYINKKS